MTTTVLSSSVISTGQTPIFSYAASGDSLIVNAGVTLSNQGDVVLAPGAAPNSGLHDLHATIDGTLSGPRAFSAYGSSVDLAVGSTGRLESSSGPAFWASHDSSVFNQGAMRSRDGTGVVIESPTVATIENGGLIHGRQGAASFLSDFTGSATLVNHGTMAAQWGDAIYSNAGTTQVFNEGTILVGGTFGAGIYIRGGNWDVTETATIANSGTILSTLHHGIHTSRVSTHLTNDGTIGGGQRSLQFYLSGSDTVTNRGHLDGRAELGGGDDVYRGELGRVTGAVWGQAGDDLLAGGAFADVLGGDSGDDTVHSGGGADTLTGAAGADRLSGGLGNDVFRFAAAGEPAGDAIVGSGGAAAFSGAGMVWGDRIDVSAIDANALLAGNQSFEFGNAKGPGRLWAEDVGTVTHIRGNVTGAAVPDFDLAIRDGPGQQADDYASMDFIL